MSVVRRFKFFRWRTVLLFFAAICSFGLARISTPRVIELYYSEGLFVFVRLFFDYTLAELPISIAPIIVGLFLYKMYRNSRVEGSFLKQTLCASFHTVLILLILFYWLWGFNYQRVRLVSRLPIESSSVDVEQLTAWTKYELGQLDSIHIYIERSGQRTLDKEDKFRISTLVKNSMLQFGYRAIGQPRLRTLPKGMLFRVGTTGFYNLFLGEAVVDGALLDVQLPFVAAHEFAHAYGIAPEGEANFFALVACSKSSVPIDRYSAHLAILRYLLSDLYKADQRVYYALYQSMPHFVKQDIDAIRKNYLQYPELFSWFRDLLYDRYLKMQGLDKGLSDYNELVNYYAAWQKSKKFNQ